MSRTIPLGVLDLGWRPTGKSPGEVLIDTAELAPIVEALGFRRYWLAEHHGDGFAHASPEILLPLIAGLTSTIVVGTAGILLRCYSPFKVASDFALLETLFPGRIDLGVARAVPDPEVLARLAGVEAMPYEAKVRALLDDARGDALGMRRREPATWIMGQQGGAALAAELGAGLAFSICHSDVRPGRDLVARYRDAFQPRSPRRAEPRAVVAVAGICAETAAQARALWEDRPRRPSMIANVLGTPAAWRAFLVELTAAYQPDEIVFVDLCERLEDRVRSHRLLAEAWS